MVNVDVQDGGVVRRAQHARGRMIAASELESASTRPILGAEGRGRVAQVHRTRPRKPIARKGDCDARMGRRVDRVDSEETLLVDRIGLRRKEVDVHKLWPHPQNAYQLPLRPRVLFEIR
eukprot:4970861-Prymnesium_polylepis.3